MQVACPAMIKYSTSQKNNKLIYRLGVCACMMGQGILCYHWMVQFRALAAHAMTTSMYLMMLIRLLISLMMDSGCRWILSSTWLQWTSCLLKGFIHLTSFMCLSDLFHLSIWKKNAYNIWKRRGLKKVTGWTFCLLHLKLATLIPLTTVEPVGSTVTLDSMWCITALCQTAMRHCVSLNSCHR